MAIKKKEPKAAVKAPKEVVAAPKVAVSGPKWVKVTLEEMFKFQAENRLAGWNPDTMEALIN